MKLIASDLDGSLLRQDGTVSDYTKDILRTLIREKNCLFLPTTGRSYRSAEKTIGDIEEIRYFSTSGGCLLYDRKEDKILMNHVIPAELAYEIFIDVQKLGGAMEIHSGLDSYLDKEKYALAQTAFHEEVSDKMLSATILRSLKSIKKGIRFGKMQVNKFNAVFRSEKDQQRIYDKYKDRDDVIVTLQGPVNLGICYAGCDKDSALALIQEKEGIDDKDVMVVEALKEVAGQNVGSSVDDGPAHFLEDHFLKTKEVSAKDIEKPVKGKKSISKDKKKATKNKKEAVKNTENTAKDAVSLSEDTDNSVKEPEKSSQDTANADEKTVKPAEETKSDKSLLKEKKKKEKTPVSDAAKKSGNKKGLGKMISTLAILLLIVVLVAGAAVYLFTMDGSPLFETMIQDEIDDFEDSQSRMDADYVGTGRVPVDVIDESSDFFNVYYMDTLSKTAPIVISIHGGGLITGNKEYNHYACEELCSRGCLVYAIDYQLVPDVHMPDQLEEISQKIDLVMEDARSRGYMTDKVSLLGDEAGGLLALYTAAAQYDDAVAQAFDMESIASTPIASIGVFSGLFYTTGLDRVGVFMSNHYYGNFYQSKKFAKYLDPDYLAANVTLPPIYLVSSSGDSLKSDTEKFANALTNAGQSAQVNMVEDDRLEYDFPITHPYADASQQVFDEITKFFKAY